MGIGKRIMTLRKAVNLTQEAFASRLKISKGFVSNLEKERVLPSNQLIHLISYEYSSSENWLITGEGEMFFSAEEVIKNHIARLGEKEYLEAFFRIIEERGLVVTLSALSSHSVSRINDDSELNRIITFLTDLFSLGDEKLRNWALYQFERAFPKDVEDEVQKKLAQNQKRESTA